jgi:hypothetical protein
MFHRRKGQGVAAFDAPLFFHLAPPRRSLLEQP